MNQRKLRKNNKLSEFSNRLAQLNGQTSKGQYRLNLQQLRHHSQTMEAEISAVLNQISEHELKNSQKILSITNQLIGTVREVSHELLDRLQQLKHQQLQNIKEDVQNYLQHQQNVKKTVGMLSKKDQPLSHLQIKGHEQTMAEFQKLKYFNVGSIHQKINQSSYQREAIQSMVSNFGGLQNALRAILVQQTRKSSRQSQTPSIESKIKVDQGSCHTQIQFSSIQQMMDGRRAQAKTADLFDRVQSERQQNLIEQSCPAQLSEVRSNVKIEPEHDSQISDRLEGRTEKARPINRAQNQSSWRDNNIIINNLDVLKNRCRADWGYVRQSETASIKQKLIRVRSQQNITTHFQQDSHFLKRSQTNLRGLSNLDAAPQDMEATNTIKAKDLTQLSTKQKLFKKQDSLRKGNWASILKEQQEKYSEIRRMIKK